MRDRLAEFRDAEVAVVTFSVPEQVAEYHRTRLSPLTVLIDADRRSYRDYGFGRGALARIWGPNVLLAYARLLAAGRRPHRPVDDTRQLGGDVVVDADGFISFLFRSRHPDDRPDVDELVAALGT